MITAWGQLTPPGNTGAPRAGETVKLPGPTDEGVPLTSSFGAAPGLPAWALLASGVPVSLLWGPNRGQHRVLQRIPGPNPLGAHGTHQS